MNLIAATYAPMHSDLSLNLDAVREYGDFLKFNNIKGSFINGSTGDFTSLSTNERKDIVEAWSAQRIPGFQVINHVGHTSLLEAVDLAKHSVGLADGVAVIAPYYFKVRTLDKLVEYCKEVATAAPELPFYYYHIPVLSGTHFNMRDFIEMASDQIPNFRGVKFTHNDFVDFQQCVQYKHRKDSDLELFFGIDEMFVNSIALGGYGWVGSTYNHLAPLYHEIYKSFNEQQYERANFLQNLAVQFVQILDGYGGFNGAGKSFMKILGIDCGPSRFPHQTLSDADLKRAQMAMEQSGLNFHMLSINH